jgi:CxxC-x17-CxxC domain-containing protein
VAYSDRTISCVDCGQPFVFSAAEQEVFANRGFTNDPKRCPACRAVRRGDRYGDNGGGTYRNYGPRQMFEVTCASCGRPAQVPFEPKGTRPVYCNDCYQKTRTTRY